MNTIFENGYKFIDKVKSKTKKFKILSRYLEELIINSELKVIEEVIESKNSDYIKFIGGLGSSRVLQFCVTKVKSEEQIKKDIEFILSNIKKIKQRIKKEEVTYLLNNAIIHEKYEVVDFIFSNKELSKKINFEDCNYMIIKNLLLEDKHNILFKKLIVEEKIKVDIKIENMIEKSKNEEMKNFSKKYANYKRVMNKFNSLPKEKRVKI